MSNGNSPQFLYPRVHVGSQVLISTNENFSTPAPATVTKVSVTGKLINATGTTADGDTLHLDDCVYRYDPNIHTEKIAVRQLQGRGFWDVSLETKERKEMIDQLESLKKQNAEFADQLESIKNLVSALEQRPAPSKLNSPPKAN